MNHHQRKTLHAVFGHPLAANIDLKDALHLLEALGAEIDNKRGARMAVALQGRTTVLHHSEHSLPKGEVMQLRKFLETCGITPEAYPL